MATRALMRCMVAIALHAAPTQAALLIAQPKSGSSSASATLGRLCGYRTRQALNLQWVTTTFDARNGVPCSRAALHKSTQSVVSEFLDDPRFAQLHWASATSDGQLADRKPLHLRPLAQKRTVVRCVGERVAWSAPRGERRVQRSDSCFATLPHSDMVERISESLLEKWLHSPVLHKQHLLPTPANLEMVSRSLRRNASARLLLLLRKPIDAAYSYINHKLPSAALSRSPNASPACTLLNRLVDLHQWHQRWVEFAARLPQRVEVVRFDELFVDDNCGPLRRAVRALCPRAQVCLSANCRVVMAQRRTSNVSYSSPSAKHASRTWAACVAQAREPARQTSSIEMRDAPLPSTAARSYHIPAQLNHLQLGVLRRQISALPRFRACQQHRPRGQVARLETLRSLCTLEDANKHASLNMTYGTRWALSSLCVPRDRAGSTLWPSCSVVGGSGALLWPPRRGAEIDLAAAVFRVGLSPTMYQVLNTTRNMTGIRTTVRVLKLGADTGIGAMHHACTRHEAAEARLLFVLFRRHTCHGAHLTLPWPPACRSALVVHAQVLYPRIELSRVQNSSSLSSPRYRLSTGGATLLATRALCARTTVFGFDPPSLNQISNRERAERGWWPYHFYNTREPGDKACDVSKHGRRVCRAAHDFANEWHSFCALCSIMPAVFEYKLPDALKYGNGTCACRIAMARAPAGWAAYT